MNSQELNGKAKAYLLNPSRNKRGCITVKYFRNVILIYMLFIKEAYTPGEFKEYITSLSILDKSDKVFMNTRDYPIWKHHIDRAKQWLLDNTYIYEDNNKFYLNRSKIKQYPGVEI